MAVLVGTLKQDILTLLALVVFSSVLESLFSPFGAPACNESLVRRNLIQDKKLQQFCDKICQPPHFPAEIYLLRNCRCNLTFCRVFENEKKNSLKVEHWSRTSGGKIDCCPLICALAQTGQSQDNHLAHTTTIYPQPCDRTHLYMCNEAQAVCTGTPLKILSDQYDLNGGWFSPNKEPSRSLSIRIYAFTWKRFVHHKTKK